MLKLVPKDRTPIVAPYDVGHVGSFNRGEDGENCKLPTFAQRVVIRRPGFVWYERGRITRIDSEWSE